jgi:hypothetical protein
MPIIDFADDPQGELLKSKLPEPQVPDFIKEASYLDEEALNRLPDDLFALVMVGHENTMRKFACVDKGNTAISVIYFLENKDRLPYEAQKTAAVNLMTACDWYGLDVPAQLKKLASVPPSGKKLTKGADLVGTEVMPTSPPLEKKAAHLDPYVSADGLQIPIKTVAPERYTDEFYCLVKEGSAQYPIRSMDEVEKAISFFEDNGWNLHPEDRREYCVKLANRATAVGLPLPDGIRKYASQNYAPDGEIKLAIHTRLQFFTEDGPERDLLKGLMDKQAAVPPDTFAEALRLFDETTGLDHHWDESVYDPYYSTYGFKKEATWSFIAGNDRVTEDQLHALVKADLKLLKCRFGEEMAEEFAKKPQEIFDSLPLDSKRIIMRMANEVGRTKQAI